MFVPCFLIKEVDKFVDLQLSPFVENDCEPLNKDEMHHSTCFKGKTLFQINF